MVALCPTDDELALLERHLGFSAFRDGAYGSRRSISKQESATTSALLDFFCFDAEGPPFSMVAEAEDWRLGESSSSEATPSSGASSVGDHGPPSDLGGADFGFVPGTAVFIVGLQRAPSFNGLQGMIESWDEAEGRYNLLLLSPARANGQRRAKVKPENLRSAMPMGIPPVPPPVLPPNVI